MDFLVQKKSEIDLSIPFFLCKLCSFYNLLFVEVIVHKKKIIMKHRKNCCLIISNNLARYAVCCSQDFQALIQGFQISQVQVVLEESIQRANTCKFEGIVCTKVLKGFLLFGYFRMGLQESIGTTDRLNTTNQAINAKSLPLNQLWAPMQKLISDSQCFQCLFFVSSSIY